MRKRDKGLQYFFRLNGNRLEKLFLELEGGFEDWASGGQQNVLLFDPTWGTNKYGLKLACFCTVAPTGKTIINSVCLIQDEDTFSFEWCFRCFADVFRVPPSAFFTDGDPKIATAFGLVSAVETDPWHDTEHFLCVFHISVNFSKHLKPLFSTNAAWHHVNSL